MKTWLRRLGEWLDARLNLRASLGPLLSHPIPKGAAGTEGWFYVFGSASMTLFALQIISGIGLALVYVPAADKAYESLLYLNYEQPLGWFLRALHYYAGSGMVVLVLAHMTQVFLHGAYKYPRELTWIVGVCLLLFTLGMFFSGQILRWDPDAYWGLAVAGSMAGRVPGLGPWLVTLLLGEQTIGGNALSRFFTVHVFATPALLVAFIAVHLWLVIKKGVSAPPVPGEPVDPRTYDAEYQTELNRGVPFLGDAIRKDIFFSALAVIVVVVLAALIGPKGPSAPPDPTLGGANPRPEWPFLWLFALLSLSPAGAETFIILVFPLLLIVALFIVPLVSNRGQRAPSRRPVAVLAVIVIYTILGVLTYQGSTAPWSPQMTAWSGEPVPVNIVRRCTPRQLQGAIVFQNKDCRNCHALEGSGGKRGPDLSGVGARLTSGQLIDQVSNGTPGGGNMPAYGKQISPDEMTALVDFLTSLRNQKSEVGDQRSAARPPTSDLRPLTSASGTHTP
jgi:ubiquinol-cytochrome c reductase cytochrome b subunit